MNQTELGRIIRFHLSQMRVNNEFHPFEDLCRMISKERIARNILPATGPVSAGGDQGRDFETYRSFLDVHAVSFIGLEGDQTIVFSCTLQQDNLPDKISRDVNAITAGPVDHVVYFCEADVPVGLRHQIQQRISETYGLTIDIFDGSAITEHLSDQDLWWVAQEYLRLPAETFPQPIADDEDYWYFTIKEKWGDPSSVPPTPNVFFEVKEATRYAWEDGAHLEDVYFWIDVLRRIHQESEAPDLLKRDAIYEASLAALRGVGTLEPVEGLLAEFFESVASVLPSGKLEDAATLLQYCFGAALRPEVPSPALADVLRWQSTLIKHLDQELRATDNDARLAALHFAKGCALQPHDPMAMDLEDAFIRIATEWHLSLDHADRSAMYPVERLADILAPVAPIFNSLPEYRPLVDRVDSMVSERAGRSAAAAKARDRALALLHGDQLAAALREFHDARERWLTGDTIRGSMLAMMLIAKCYERLGLHLASKYYSLAVHKLALDSGTETLVDLASQSVLSAALSDYQTGAWLGFLDLAEYGTAVHTFFDSDPWDFDEHEILSQIGLPAWVIYTLARGYLPDLEAEAERVFHHFGSQEDIQEFLDDPSSPWGRSLDEFCAAVSEQLFCKAIDDLATERQVTWSALGIRWTARFDNDYTTVLAAERLVAVLQILLADLGGVDLCLLPTRCEFVVDVGAEYETELLDHNVVSRWRITVVPWEREGNLPAHEVSTLAIAVSVLSEMSVMNQEDLNERFEETFRNGMFSKASPLVQYEDVLGEIISRDQFDRSLRGAGNSPCPTPADWPAAHRDLSWYDGLGPNYSRDKADQFLVNRYDALTRRTRHTAARLMMNPEFGETVNVLRNEGYLDWQILGAVNTAAMTWRTNLSQPATPEEWQRAQQFWVDQEEEDPDAPVVPVDQFLTEELTMMMDLNNLSSLRTWDHNVRTATPDLIAVNEFLKIRYRHYDDDINHEDPFPM